MTDFSGEIVKLDLSQLKTTPFEPKLPLPKSFESELMKTGIRQLEPLINQYLLSKPLCLPADIEPLVAYPEVFLNQTEDGLGFVQILSYCTCSDFQAPGSFSKCDSRSQLCQLNAISRGKRSSQQEISAPVISKRETEMEPRVLEGKEESDDVELPRFVQFLNKSKTFHKATDWLNEKIDGWMFDKNETEPDEEDVMITNWFESGARTPLSPEELLFIQFDSSTDCSLKNVGDKAIVYRLKPKSYCSSIVKGDNAAPTGDHYVFKPDGSSLNFGCYSKYCKGCQFQDVKIQEKDVCVPWPSNGVSFVATHNETFVKEKLSSTNGTTAISFIFNGRPSCDLHSARSKALVGGEMVAWTYQLGREDQGCVQMATGVEMTKGKYLQIDAKGSPKTNISLECEGNISLTGRIECHSCQHRFTIPRQEGCQQAPPGLLDNTTVLEYFKSPLQPGTQEHSQEALDVEDDKKLLLIILAISLSVGLVLLVLTIAACVWCLQNEKGGNKRINNYCEKLRTALVSTVKSFCAVLTTHFGFRFLTWKAMDRIAIFEDVMQNIFCLTNGICAILFAFEWNSPNNPLLLFNTKISTKMGFGNKILDMSPIETFSSKLNFWTYIVNIANGFGAFALVLLWCFTRTGYRQQWTKLRLLSAVSMLASILLTIACVVFTTYFDELVTLKTNTGFFITDNEKMSNISKQVKIYQKEFFKD